MIKTKKKAAKKAEKPFSRLTKAEKRVAIARDVIAQLKAKTIIAEQGTYVFAELKEGCKLDYYSAKDTQLNKLLQNKQAECICCGIGSLWVAKVNKTNHVKLKETYQFDSQNRITEALNGVFSKDQLVTIEAAFEGTDIGDVNDILEDEDGKDTPLMDKCRAFYDKYDEAHDRLKAIMSNIIKNNGEFRP